MKKNKIAIALFICALLNIVFINITDAEQLTERGISGKTTVLTEDATAGKYEINLSETDDTTIDGQGFSIDGSAFDDSSAWLGSYATMDCLNNSLLNIGKFQLTEAGASIPDTVILLNDANEAVRYIISDSGSIHGFVNDNTHTLNGSVISNFSVYNSAKITIDNSVIKDNHIANGTTKGGHANGGAIFYEDEEIEEPGLSISNSYITQNSADSSRDGNVAVAQGGAVYINQRESSSNISNSFFTDNHARSNTESTDSKAVASGGAIHNNKGLLNISNTYFGGNSVTGSKAQGGAVFTSEHSPASDTDASVFSKTVFENNSVNATVSNAIAGALHTNCSNTITDSLFLSNKVVLNPTYQTKDSSILAAGGAVVTASSFHSPLYINNISNTVFQDNSVEFKNSEIVIPDNAQAQGGALKITNIKTDVKNSTFKGNSVINEYQKADVIASGGAIALTNNFSSRRYTHDISSSAFDSNKVVSEGTARGGAVAVFGNMANMADTGSNNIITANFNDTVFTNNAAESKAALGTGAKGGAIYANDYTFVNVNNSLFDSNSAKSAAAGDVKYGGGAAYVSNNGVLTAVDTSFVNNTAIGEAASGGAIYNEAGGTVNIIAKDKNVVFSGNKAGLNQDNLSSNAIYDAGGTLNFNVAEGKEIVFNDSVVTSDNTSININNKGTWDKTSWAGSDKIPNDAPFGESTGTVVLNGDMSGFKGDVSIAGGTILLAQNGTFFNNAKSFSVLAPSTLNVANNVTQSHNFSNFTLNAPLNVALDIDPLHNVMDSFNVANATVGENAKINIKDIHIMNDVNAGNETSMYIGDIGENEELMDIITLDESVQTAMGDIYKFDMEYDPESATLKMKKQGGSSNGGPAYQNLNPAIMAGSVATQAAYLTQLNSYDMAFQNILSKMMMPKLDRNAETMQNRFAISEGDVYYSEDGSHTWFKPYTSIEQIDLKHGPDVDNVMYGTFIGNDGKVHEFKNGKKAQLSSYFAYNGSRQSYDGNKIYQNGGLVGFTGAFYRDNFYAALTANAGMSVAMTSTTYGDDNIPIFTTGTAMQSGYNFELADGKFILQPNVLVSYSFINTFDYTNARDLRIDSDPMHAMQVAPGFRIFGRTKSGWQPYISTAMKWNFIDDPSFTAANVTLPELSVKPYVEYGVGLQKSGGENVNGYLQTLVRNGGRTGVAFSAGLDILLGKDKKEKVQEYDETDLQAVFDVNVTETEQPKTDKKIDKKADKAKKDIKKKTDKNIKNTKNTAKKKANKKANKKPKAKKNWGYYRDPYVRNIK